MYHFCSVRENDLSNFLWLTVLVNIAAQTLSFSMVSRKLAFGLSILLRIWTTSN